MKYLKLITLFLVCIILMEHVNASSTKSIFELAKKEREPMKSHHGEATEVDTSKERHSEVGRLIKKEHSEVAEETAVHPEAVPSTEAPSLTTKNEVYKGELPDVNASVKPAKEEAANGEATMDELPPVDPVNTGEQPTKRELSNVDPTEEAVMQEAPELEDRPAVNHPEFTDKDLPPVDLPPVDLPPVDLPPVDLPGEDLPPQDSVESEAKNNASMSPITKIFSAIKEHPVKVVAV
eukprot:526243_1